MDTKANAQMRKLDSNESLGYHFQFSDFESIYPSTISTFDRDSGKPYIDAIEYRIILTY